MTTPDDHHLDLVLYGATGFVGRLIALHLARTAPADARIALGGRSRDKLERLRAELPGAAAAWPLLVVDATDAGAVAAMAAGTKVVATTVGPYAKYGVELVKACVAAGTHYADLAGEVLFVRDCADELHDKAVRTGARIVNACGFDSVPSDLGVLLTARRAADEGAGELTETVLLVVGAKGGFSGGTIDSLRTQVDVVADEPTLARVLADPYALSPDRAGEPDPGDGPNRTLPGREPMLGGRWVAPFVMAPFNTRIVRRSNALTGWSYGRGFRYDEVMGVGRSSVAPILAGAVAGGLGFLAEGLKRQPLRAVLDRLLPDPGEGPSEKAREAGHFTVEVHAETTSGRRYVTTVAAQGDPGYAATAVMFGQAALALALDNDLPDAAGVLTPSTGIGMALVTRLRAQGFTLATRQV